jgi:hypothetical protein
MTRRRAAETMSIRMIEVRKDTRHLPEMQLDVEEKCRLKDVEGPLKRLRARSATALPKREKKNATLTATSRQKTPRKRQNTTLRQQQKWA